MMKLKKVSSLAMVLAMLMSAAACGGTTAPPGESTGGEDASGKTILKVGTYDGGVGTAWLDDAAKAFEEKYAGVSFNAGEMGVKVDVVGTKGYNGATLLDGTLDRDVYFTENVSYFDHVNKGNFANITDIVTETLTEYNETTSIEGKLDKLQQDYLKAKDGQYYAIPFYDGIYGMIYDRDMFNNNKWFFDADGDIGVNESGNLSAGPDGNMETTYDNGLPATYEQFEELLSTIRGKTITPFSYSGFASDYVKRMLMNLWSDYEGYDQMRLNYTFDGTANIVTSIDGETVTTEATPIDATNGYLLQKQAGKYYALQFMDEILLGNSANIPKNGVSHTDAQKNYIVGDLAKGEGGAKIYAMHIDGIWWESEATASFANYETIYGKGKQDRRFAFMPIPKVSADKVGKQTLISLNDSYAFINKNASNMELAKAFLQFVHTDAQMSAFTAKTSTTRSLQYEIASADEAKMSYFGKSIIEMKKNSDIVYPLSSVEKVINNPSYFSTDAWGWSSLVGGNPYKDPFMNLLEVSGLTAESYFKGLSSQYSQNSWNGLK